MKKIMIKSYLAFLITIFIQVALFAQFVVKVKPKAPAVARTRARAHPPGQVWIDGEWIWRNDQYVYIKGSWVQPAYPGAKWIPGHWKFHTTKGGWFWFPGYWSRT